MKKILTAVTFLLFNLGINAQDVWWEQTNNEYQYNLKNRRILVIFDEEFDWHETILIPKMWKQLGAEITYCGDQKSINGRIKRKIGNKFDNTESTSLQTDILISDVKAEEFDLIYFPGGYGPKNVLIHTETRDKVLNIIQTGNKQKQLLAAICHGPVLFAAAGIIENKYIAGHHAVELPVIIANGHYIKEKAVVDGNLISGNWPYFETFASTVAKKLENYIFPSSKF